MSIDELSRIRMAYAERERTLPGTLKRDTTNPGNRLLLDMHRRRLQQILRQKLDRPLESCRVLDVGCGYGGLLGWFHDLGVPAGNLFGVDLLTSRISAARETYPRFTFLEGNAMDFEFPAGSFDLVPLFTVFSSILDPAMARNLAGSVDRVLAEDGAVVWYDMRYPNPGNRHLRAMPRRRIQALFPAYTLELESISLLPPLARRLGRSTEVAYPLLAALPPLRSHLLGLLRRTNPPMLARA
jgi:SAM-dependent methyltransferase